MNKTNAIGLLIPDIENPFFAKLVKSIEDELRKNGYITIIMNTGDSFENDQAFANRILSSGVDGILLVLSNDSYRDDKEQQGFINKINVPKILVDRGVAESNISQVYYDNSLGGYLATKYLLENGHKNIGVMTATSSLINSYYRYKGYEKAMKEYGIKIKEAWHVQSDFSMKDSYSKADLLLNQKEITAIFAANDMMAYGIVKRAIERKISIPNDISLIGYDNLNFSEILAIPLTSVNQDVEALAKKATELMLSEIKTKENQKKIIELIPNIRIRNSVKKV